MRRIQEWVLKQDFRRFFKGLLLLCLAAAVLGGALAAVGLRTQICQGIAYVQQREQIEGLEDGNIESGYQGELRDRWERLPITEPSRGTKLLLAGLAGVWCLLFGVYWLALAGAVYQAAVLADMNGPVWLLAGLCGNLLGGLLFLVVRSVVRRRCDGCGHWQNKRARYCANCGGRLLAACPTCAETMAVGTPYCPACGSRMDSLEEENGGCGAGT